MPTNQDAAGKTILVADDDVRLLEALSSRLQAMGFAVIRCQDAYMATDMARRHTPDVILLDMNMPAGQGDATHERLRTFAETAHIPVIYVTGDKSKRVQLRADELGAFAVIHKPFDITELTAYILSAVRRNAA